MNELCKSLSKGLQVEYSCRPNVIKKQEQSNILFDENHNDLGSFDLVVSTAPPIQAVDLLREFPDITAKIDKVKMLPCFTVMLAVENLDIPYQACFINDNKSLSWLAVNSTKPDRDSDIKTIILHSATDYALKNVDINKDEILNQMLEDFVDITGFAGDILFKSIHRWLYSLAENPLEEGYIFDKSQNIALCGDWLNGQSKLENAYLSGYTLAKDIINLYK